MARDGRDALTSDTARAETASGLDATLDRIARVIGDRRPPTRAVFIVVLGLVSFIAAMIVARVTGPNGPWLFNIDLPKIDYPRASFYRDALAGGRLPFWNDDLGLGFPLYAEGQIGAFYPPNWLIFQLDPLVALDVTRVLHLVLAGVGTGILALRLSGSRTGAVLAAVVAVTSGTVVAKLEWHNVIAAYSFLPWILIPLVRRPAPTRRGLVAAGVIFGLQALHGHPNTWLLTGIAAAVVMLAIAPRPRTLLGVVGFGLIGSAVGAVQLLPTVLIQTLSVRNDALSANDVFTNSATPFDVLLLAFQNAFALAPDGSWVRSTMWYPDGTFGLLEAAAYVGLPVLALAALGLRAPRARPWIVLGLVGIAIPVLGAFRPEPWMGIPFINGLRSPVRSYMLLTFAIAILAAIGIGRLGRSPGGFERARIGILLPVAVYVVVVALVKWVPDVFDGLMDASSTFGGAGGASAVRERAIAALTNLWPLLLELALGGAILAVVAGVYRRPSTRLALAPVALAVAVLPLILLGPMPNPTRPLSEFSYADSPFIVAAKATAPHRFLTLDPPRWYTGLPDQLAAAGVPTLRMFSSLNLDGSVAPANARAGRPVRRYASGGRHRCRRHHRRGLSRDPIATCRGAGLDLSRRRGPAAAVLDPGRQRHGRRDRGRFTDPAPRGGHRRGRAWRGRRRDLGRGGRRTRADDAHRRPGGRLGLARPCLVSDVAAVGRWSPGRGPPRDGRPTHPGQRGGPRDPAGLRPVERAARARDRDPGNRGRVRLDQARPDGRSA